MVLLKCQQNKSCKNNRLLCAFLLMGHFSLRQTYFSRSFQAALQIPGGFVSFELFQVVDDPGNYDFIFFLIGK